MLLIIVKRYELLCEGLVVVVVVVVGGGGGGVAAAATAAAAVAVVVVTNRPLTQIISGANSIRARSSFNSRRRNYQKHSFPSSCLLPQ